jgi:hypothetical protein
MPPKAKPKAPKPKLPPVAAEHGTFKFDNWKITTTPSEVSQVITRRTLSGGT